jgi:hypothetical protein
MPFPRLSEITLYAPDVPRPLYKPRRKQGAHLIASAKSFGSARSDAPRPSTYVSGETVAYGETYRAQTCCLDAPRLGVRVEITLDDNQSTLSDTPSVSASF